MPEFSFDANDKEIEESVASLCGLACMAQINLLEGGMLRFAPHKPKRTVETNRRRAALLAILACCKGAMEGDMLEGMAIMCATLESLQYEPGDAWVEKAMGRMSAWAKRRWPECPDLMLDKQFHNQNAPSTEKLQ